MKRQLVPSLAFALLLGGCSQTASKSDAYALNHELYDELLRIHTDLENHGSGGSEREDSANASMLVTKLDKNVDPNLREAHASLGRAAQYSSAAKTFGLASSRDARDQELERAEKFLNEFAKSGK